VAGEVPHEQYLAELLSERGEKGRGRERRREGERDEGARGSVSSVGQLGAYALSSVSGTQFNTQFTRFISTKVQIMTPEELGARGEGRRSCISQSCFTCFTSTRAQILTPEQ
jgi:hypothetical protein